jgi:hypothetical protein
MPAQLRENGILGGCDTVTHAGQAPLVVVDSLPGLNLLSYVPGQNPRPTRFSQNLNSKSAKLNIAFPTGVLKSWSETNLNDENSASRFEAAHLGHHDLVRWLLRDSDSPDPTIAYHEGLK